MNDFTQKHYLFRIGLWSNYVQVVIDNCQPVQLIDCLDLTARLASFENKKTYE